MRNRCICRHSTAGRGAGSRGTGQSPARDPRTVHSAGRLAVGATRDLTRPATYVGAALAGRGLVRPRGLPLRLRGPFLGLRCLPLGPPRRSRHRLIGSGILCFGSGVRRGSPVPLRRSMLGHSLLVRQLSRRTLSRSPLSRSPLTSRLLGCGRLPCRVGLPRPRRPLRLGLNG